MYQLQCTVEFSINLQKGCGYHLDLLVVALMIVICSMFAFPWCEASTVPAINHVKSLTLESESAAPGDKQRFLGIREQRVTHIVVFILIGKIYWQNL